MLQTHTEHSFNIARKIDMPKVIPAIIRQYYERLDVSGYIGRLKGGGEFILEAVFWPWRAWWKP